MAAGTGWETSERVLESGGFESRQRLDDEPCYSSSWPAWTARLLEAESRKLRQLGRSAPLVLSGAGASEELCDRLHLARLDGDLVSAADVVSRSA